MQKLLCVSWLVLVTLATTAQERPAGKSRHAKIPRIQYGMASYYADKFQGRSTASGELYDKTKMTCAHNALPMGTWLKVTNVRNKKQVIVRVTDRLHHNNKRLVDLSRAAAAKLGYIKKGLVKVKVEVLAKKPAIH